MLLHGEISSSPVSKLNLKNKATIDILTKWSWGDFFNKKNKMQYFVLSVISS